MTLTSWLGWVRLAEAPAGHFLRERQITIHNQIHRLPFCFLLTFSRPCVSPLLHPRFLFRCCCCSCSRACPADLYTFLTHSHCPAEPPGINYFRQASSALRSLSYSHYNHRVILRDPSAPAHDPSHSPTITHPDRLVPGKCITASPFSRHEPDPVLLRCRPFARPASTRPVTQPSQWHLYRNTTSYDPY